MSQARTSPATERLRRMTTRAVFAAAIAAAMGLTACGSSVKLDEVPVEDKTGQRVGAQPGTGAPITSSGTGAAGAQTGQSAVQPVDLSKTPDLASAQVGARTIYFDYDSFLIKPEFQSVVEAHARYVRADRGRKVQIEGHTDERGGREYNLALGQRRAEAVRQALALLGVPDAQMEAVSFGKEKPAQEGGDEATFAKNRRAELQYR